MLRPPRKKLDPDLVEAISRFTGSITICPPATFTELNHDYRAQRGGLEGGYSRAAAILRKMKRKKQMEQMALLWKKGLDAAAIGKEIGRKENLVKLDLNQLRKMGVI